MAKSHDESLSPHRVWLLSIPRSGSHLLTRILSRQSNLSYSGYNFNDYIYLHHKLLDENVALDLLPGVERDSLLKAATDGLSQTKMIVDGLEAEGKTPFIKEHISSILDPFLTLQPVPASENHVPWKMLLSKQALNPTLLPDAYLLKFKPLILIRHPALAYPSLYRVTRALMPHISVDSKSMTTNFTLSWLRMTYTWLEQAAAEGNGYKPIVIDADDVMLDPALVRQLAVMLGGDPNKLVFSWDAVDGDDLENCQSSAKIFESTLLASQGIIGEKSASNLDIEHETQKWFAEFGEEVAEKMQVFVRNAMDDYEYLKARKLSVDSSS